MGASNLTHFVVGTARARRTVMVRGLSLTLAATCFTTAASAERMMVGAHVGVSHDEVDARRGITGNQTIGLFGRFDLTRHLAGQLDISKYDRTTDNMVVRTATATVLYRLSVGSSLVPSAMIGWGIDVGSNSWGDDTGVHLEAGLGLEYRASASLSLGAELRIGSRAAEQYAYADGKSGPIIEFPAPHLSASDYRLGRLWAGLRF